MNLSLFQSYFNVGHVDGVYWTLVLEIQFYIGIGLLLFMNCKGRRLKHFFILWPFIMLCANLINFGKYPLLGGYFSYFAAGAIFAMLHQGYNKKVTFLALCITFYLCITTSISKALMKGELVNDVFSPVVISIIIISFFLFFCAIGFDKIKSLKLPFARYAGALTYPVYLIHAHVGYILINHYATPNNKFLVYCLVILFVLVIALFIHNIIETKMYLFWQKYFKFFIRQPILILQNLKEMALAK
jgi:peptidoglycan/LPS O-acetylase OafA/YrhL